MPVIPAISAICFSIVISPPHSRLYPPGESGRVVIGGARARAAEGHAVEETVQAATGSPSPDAAIDGGNFFGIPYGWPLAAVIVGVILFMWMARHPVRQDLWQIFFITGRVFGRWGLWLKEHGQAARVTCADKIASHRADELQDRMLMLEDRIGHRAEKLPKETTPIIARLDKSTHTL